MGSKKALRVTTLYWLPGDTTLRVEPWDFQSAEQKLGGENELLQAAVRQGWCGTLDQALVLFPKGVALQKLILAEAERLMAQIGAEEWQFPTLFNDSSGVKELIKRFVKEIFTMSAGRQHLKYATDPLIFRYFEGKTVQVPLAIYSPDRFYRREPSGVRRVFTRPCEFLMTDFHCFDRAGSFAMFLKAAKVNAEAMRLWFSEERWFLSIDTNEEFLAENQTRVLEICQAVNRPVVIKVTSRKTHYYGIQLQYMADFYKGLTTQFANLQLDDVNGPRFNITDGSGDPVRIIHGTVFGRVEKIFASILGRILERIEASGVGVMPAWLSPVQVQVISAPRFRDDSHFVEVLTNQLHGPGIRFDVDSSDLAFRQKIQKASEAWIPYIVVVGEESAQGVVTVTDRRTGKKEEMTPAQLIERVTSDRAF